MRPYMGVRVRARLSQCVGERECVCVCVCVCEGEESSVWCPLSVLQQQYSLGLAGRSAFVSIYCYCFLLRLTFGGKTIVWKFYYSKGFSRFEDKVGKNLSKTSSITVIQLPCVFVLNLILCEP